MPEAAVSMELLHEIARAVNSLRYGTVQITVHNARIVQIDKLERVRFLQTVDPSRGHPDTHPTGHRTSETPPSSGGR
jgi:hypothetical protein